MVVNKFECLSWKNSFLWMQKSSTNNQRFRSKLEPPDKITPATAAM